MIVEKRVSTVTVTFCDLLWPAILVDADRALALLRKIPPVVSDL